MVVQGHTEDDEGERRSTVDFEPLEVEVRVGERGRVIVYEVCAYQ